MQKYHFLLVTYIPFLESLTFSESSTITSAAMDVEVPIVKNQYLSYYSRIYFNHSQNI